METDPTFPIVENGFQKVITLCRTGVHPPELSENVKMAERSLLYLVMLYRWTNDHEEAKNTIRTLPLECCFIIDSGDPHTSTIAVQALAEIFDALGDLSTALGCCRFLHSRSQWKCICCKTYCHRREKVAICEYHYSSFCDACLSIHPVHIRCCVKCHRLHSMRIQGCISGERVSLKIT
jgi:hypothetical protein